jgi:hypothetical protein
VTIQSNSRAQGLVFLLMVTLRRGVEQRTGQQAAHQYQPNTLSDTRSREPGDSVAAARGRSKVPGSGVASEHARDLP